jgi:hypothetical protein
MKQPLYSAHLKMVWARERHLDTLFKDMRDFYNPDHPSRVGAPPGGFRPPPLVMWSLAVADAVHNMRCALDHAAYDLAKASLLTQKLSRKPARDTAFPLLSSPNKGTFERQLQDIPEPAVRAQIEQFQPYDKRNPLWILAELNNVDKHEELKIFSAWMSLSGDLGGLPPGSSVQVNLDDGKAFRVDAEGNKEEVAPHTPSVTMQLEMPRSGNKFDVTVLQEVHTFVAQQVMPSLARFLVPVEGTPK